MNDVRFTILKGENDMTTSTDTCRTETSSNKRPLQVLLLNGSTRKNGCTYTALCEVAKALNQDGVQTEIFQMGGQGVHDCIACGRCEQLGHCVFDDDIVNQCLAHAQMADGFVFGSPVYYAHPTGQILAVLDRMFYAGKRYFMQKPGAAVVSARRAGTTASLDVLHKYFADAQMPVVSSTYWNMVHGKTPDEVRKDLEGMQTMRNLGHHLAWLLKCIRIAKEQGIHPPTASYDQWTNFIR